jgi:TonB family protein
MSKQNGLSRYKHKRLATDSLKNVLAWTLIVAVMALPSVCAAQQASEQGLKPATPPDGMQSDSYVGRPEAERARQILSEQHALAKKRLDLEVAAGRLTPDQYAAKSDISLAIKAVELAIKNLDEELLKNTRRRFVSASKAGDYQSYVDACIKKIEAIGNDYYPPEASGKLYGRAIVTFTVLASGELKEVTLDRSTGHSVLDRASLESVRRAAPFPQFTPEMTERLDVISIIVPLNYLSAAQGGREPIAQPAAAQRASPSWADAIRQKIRSNLVLPDGTPKGIRAVFSVVQRPNGDVLNVTLVSSSGHSPFDAAVQRALRVSSPLPRAPTAQEFRQNLLLTFTPDCAASPRRECTKEEIVSWLAANEGAIRRQIYYPGKAKKADQQGQVVVTAFVENDGTVKGVTINQSSGVPELDNVALNISGGKYSVPLCDGQPSQMTLTIPLDFRLVE